MECSIISPKKIEKRTELKSIILPAFWGRMEVLPGHAESFIVLTEGEIIFKTQNSQEEKLFIKKGLFYTKDNKSLIIL